MMRRSWIESSGEISLVRQCELAMVTRSTVYAAREPVKVDEDELLLCRLIGEEYTKRPFYGTRRMVVFLRHAGYVVNRKRVQRLMRKMGLAGMAPGPNTSRAILDTRFIPTYCVDWWSITRIKCGVLILPTFGWRKALPTWWQSWIGIGARF